MKSGRERTSTSAFGVGRRENHDSSAFYSRFTPPDINDDHSIETLPEDLGQIHCRDSREAAEVLPPNSVALVVTSPPYFVGKEYELAVASRASAGDAGVYDRTMGKARHSDVSAVHSADILQDNTDIPQDYFAYLEMLRDVFAACVEVLEPGGRLAVNVANLGRKPYRSLSADVIQILQDDLKLLLRGEIIWQKADGATGSVAWGSYLKASNPVLRDITERVIVASKGRFDRALSPKDRRSSNLPCDSTLTADEFMEATLDVWRQDAESAKRVGHPAPFPVELCRRLINLYTYRGDVVFDPFMGSGTTLIAAKIAERYGIGFDISQKYCELAKGRLMRLESVLESGDTTESGDIAENTGIASDSVVAVTHQQTAASKQRVSDLKASEVAIRWNGHREFDINSENFQLRAVEQGKAVERIAHQCLVDAGFSWVRKKHKPLGLGIQFNFLARDIKGRQWYVDVSGAFTGSRPGLRRTDTLWKTLGRIFVLQADHMSRGVIESRYSSDSNKISRYQRNGSYSGDDSHSSDDSYRVLILTSHLPKTGSEGYRALHSVGPVLIFDVVEMLADSAMPTLRRYANGVGKPDEGFWSYEDIQAAYPSS